jgi:hypothetical protein
MRFISVCLVSVIVGTYLGGCAPAPEPYGSPLTDYLSQGISAATDKTIYTVAGDKYRLKVTIKNDTSAPVFLTLCGSRLIVHTQERQDGTWENALYQVCRMNVTQREIAVRPGGSYAYEREFTYQKAGTFRLKIPIRLGRPGAGEYWLFSNPFTLQRP